MATDLLSATQDAVFAALAAGNLDWPVFQHVPQDQQPDFIVVGAIDAEEIGGKHDSLERHVVDVVYIFRGKARRGLFAMMHAGREAIEGADMIADGAELSDARWLQSADDLLDDGVTYQGLQQFEITAQQAD